MWKVLAKIGKLVWVLRMLLLTEGVVPMDGPMYVYNLNLILLLLLIALSIK